MKEKKVSKWMREHKMSIFVIVSAVVMLIGLSYAWLQITLRGEREINIFAAGSLQLELDDTMTNGIRVENAVPITDEEGKAQTAYTFTLTNKGTVDSDYTIYLDDLDLEEGQTRMPDDCIKYQLIKDGKEVSLDLLSTTGENPNRIFETGNITAKKTYQYELRVWIDYDAGNEVMETRFRGQLRIEAVQETPNRLYRKVASKAVLDNEASEFVSASTGINFGEAPSDTNGKGVYTLSSTKDDNYPVHYYRGAVNDNNIKFGGFCWKIVRTTNTGGVKLIYNGTPDASGACTNTTGEATQIGTSKFNENSSSLADVGYMYGTRYEYNVKELPTTGEQWIYGNDVEWDGSKYILKDTISSNTANWATDYKIVATKYHYSCFSTGNSCSEVGYIHYFSNSSPIYYLKLTGGKDIEDAKKEMFTNTNDSIMKQTIDNWYASNMVEYTDKLEDTIWCNDRSIDRGPLKNKDEDSSIITGNNRADYTFFSVDRRNLRTISPSVECTNKNDRFTVSDKIGNGKLTYPVALLTADELTLAGHGWNGYSDSSYLHTDQTNWALSPRYYDYDNARVCVLRSSGNLLNNFVNEPGGVRPTISLGSTATVADGDGTPSNPFTIVMD